MKHKEFIFPPIRKGEEPYNSMIQGMLIHDDLMKSYLEKLDGLNITTYAQVMTCETTIEFEYKGHQFITDNAYMVWSFITDQDCPDEIISGIIEHLYLMTRNQ
jgi:hypothetical protein